jgi:hypothetical protein
VRVAHHVGHAQALDGDGPVPGHNLAGLLMMEVQAFVADASVGFGHQQFGPTAVLAAAPLGLEPALTPCQRLFGLALLFRKPPQSS